MLNHCIAEVGTTQCYEQTLRLHDEQLDTGRATDCWHPRGGGEGMIAPPHTHPYPHPNLSDRPVG